MSTLTVVSPTEVSSVEKSRSAKYVLTLPTPEFRNQPIPGLANEVKVGHCFVRVTDIPLELDSFLQVNPRVPNRNDKGVLSGPVTTGILRTLRDSPREMAIKNQGIYILVESCEFRRLEGGGGVLTLTLADSKLHGIVNGGHTYAAIREAVDNAASNESQALKEAYVQLHILQGIDANQVPEIAEGLNRSKQVDEWSLFNLDHKFEQIKKVLKGKPGHDAIAYNQGGDGDIYVSEVVVMLEAFNRERFNEKNHPSRLYRRSSMALQYFKADSEGKNPTADLLVTKAYDILALGDKIKKAIPQAADNNGFKFGLLKPDNKKKGERAGSPSHKNSPLPFIGETMDYRVPNGWVLPILAAFRANVKWDLATKTFEWIAPIDKILQATIDELAGICVTAHRDDNIVPEQVGTRQSIYQNCYKTVALYVERLKA